MKHVVLLTRYYAVEVDDSEQFYNNPDALHDKARQMVADDDPAVDATKLMFEGYDGVEE